MNIRSAFVQVEIFECLTVRFKEINTQIQIHSKLSIQIENKMKENEFWFCFFLKTHKKDRYKSENHKKMLIFQCAIGCSSFSLCVFSVKLYPLWVFFICINYLKWLVLFFIFVQWNYLSFKMRLNFVSRWLKCCCYRWVFETAINI